MSILTGLLLAMSLAMPAAAEQIHSFIVPYQVSLASWEPQVGDRVIVDTQNNQGYIFHENGLYISFPVATGQRRWVYYIGRGYNASTPNWNWEAKSLHIKGDRITFGPSGRFLRLYKDGEINTAYGFHEYRTDEEMFGADEQPFEASERFKSMGCVIVKSEIMDLIVATWEANGEVLPVQTVYGIENLSEVMLAMNVQNSI